MLSSVTDYVVTYRLLHQLCLPMWVPVDEKHCEIQCETEYKLKVFLTSLIVSLNVSPKTCIATNS